ncbi:MAG: hypothetical protein JWP29_4391 [Rhodoferax sp.]|nr:hypothetical protein [Rhodoferax sp.]
MPLKPTRSTRRPKIWLTALCLLALAACTTPPPRAPASLFEQDVVAATDGLVGQWRSNAPLRPRWPASRLALGPFVDLSANLARPGPAFAQQQSVAAVRARQMVARHVVELQAEFQLVSTAADSSAPADLLLSASLIPVVLAGEPLAANPTLMLTLVLLDIKTRTVVARWQNPLRSQVADTYPSAFEGESPVLPNRTPTDARTDLYRAPVNTVVDAATLGEALGLTRLSQAQAAYAAGNYPEALAGFQEVAAKSPDLALRAYNGQYLSYLKLDQPEAARQAFKRVVAAGFASRRLAVKLLFAPGQTEFWSDPEVSGAYGFWLQEIAAQAVAASTCLEVAGHTSHSGEETFNADLSLARGERVRQVMLASRPPLASRLKARGKGWSENIVGSGTDDARDAIDRRVEFKIVDCARKP